jgi:hypothetical protein
MRRRERRGWWRAQCRFQRRLCEGRSVDENQVSETVTMMIRYILKTSICHYNHRWELTCHFRHCGLKLGRPLRASSSDLAKTYRRGRGRVLSGLRSGRGSAGRVVKGNILKSSRTGAGTANQPGRELGPVTAAM